MSGEKVLYYQGGKYQDKTFTKAIIATGVTIINKDAFYKCKKLHTVVFKEPHQVTEIGDYAFYGCETLESIQLPESLVKIGRWAFNGCPALRRIVIPGIVTLGRCAFEGSGIEEIVISDGVKSIDFQAFSGCPRLYTVRLPASLKEIHLRSFSGCPRLENVVVPADGLPLLKTLAFHGAYESRGWEAACMMAQKAPHLTSLSLIIVLSDGLQSIQPDIFQLPTTLEFFRLIYFRGGGNLENVIVPADGLPLLKTLVFDGSYPRWEAMCKIARNAPSLTSLSLSHITLGPEERCLDDSDIPSVVDLFSCCLHLESLDLSHNKFSDQVIRKLDSEGILGRLRRVCLWQNRFGKRSMFSSKKSKEFLDLLKKNPRLAIWTDHEPERLIRHQLDMNRFGCYSVPVEKVSILPRLIHRVGTIDRRLRTCPANVIFHLLRGQSNYLCDYYQQHRLLLEEQHTLAEEDNEE